MSNTKKRTRTTYKKELKAILKQTKDKLLINNWTLHINYFQDDTDGNQPGWDATANIDINHRYYTAEINFFKTHYEIYKAGDDYNFKKTIVHELCHILTEPLYLIAEKATSPNQDEKLQDTREQSTEQLANIIINK